jgi:hypothetical protein
MADEYFTTDQLLSGSSDEPRYFSSQELMRPPEREQTQRPAVSLDEFYSQRPTVSLDQFYGRQQEDQPRQSAVSLDQFYGREQPQRTYSPNELTHNEPQDEGAFSAFLKGAKHALGPAIAGAAAFPAGAIPGAEIGAAVGGPFAWATAPIGGLLGGAAAAYGAARAAQPVSEYALDKLGLGDDVASQAASRKAHPWAYGAGEIAAQAPVLGPSLTAKLGERALGAAVGGVTEAVTQPEARTLPEAGAGYSTAAGDDGTDHDARVRRRGRAPGPARGPCCGPLASSTASRPTSWGAARSWASM